MENIEVVRHYRANEKINKLRKHVAVGAIAIIGVFGIQNHETIDAYSPFFGQGDTLPQINGCEVDASQRKITLPEVDDVFSSARNFESAGVRPLDTINTVRTFFDYPQDSFISSVSGIEFVFYSDTEQADWHIDHEAFDEIFHFALTTDHDYAHPGAAETIQCLRERVINDQEFSGQEYSIYIPNNLRSCLGNGRIIDLDQEPEAKCQQRGFAPPAIDIKLGPIELFNGHIMVLTGGRSNEESLVRLAFHESMHAHTALPGEQSFQLDPNEKWVTYQQRVLTREAAEDYAKLRPFITFTDADK